MVKIEAIELVCLTENEIEYEKIEHLMEINEVHEIKI